MNIAKLSIKDVNRIKEMTLLNIYRYSLKLIRTYPSIKRDELREVIILGNKIIINFLNILEYHEKKNLTNADEIKRSIEQGQVALNHLITYELKRREMLDIGTNKVDQQFHLGPTHFSLNENKHKEKEEKFEYFDA